MKEKITDFLSSKAFGVVGASSNRKKFGNKVLRCLLLNNMTTYPVNPNEKIIEGLACISDVRGLPASVESISIITPPKITELIIEDIVGTEIQNVWMQPGAESEVAIARAHQLGLNIIAGGPCILVELGYFD